jgi:hypothetical protein
LDRRLGGPQTRSGRDGEEKYSQPLLGIEPPIIQPVAQSYTTELYLKVEMGNGEAALHKIPILKAKLSSWLSTMS